VILGGNAWAQDAIESGRQLAQKIYSASEKIVKDSIDEKMRLFSAQRRRDGQPLTSEDLEVGLDIITRSQYQYLIDNLVCAEQLSDEMRSNGSALPKCTAERTKSSNEMAQLWVNHGSLLEAKGIHASCSARTRQFSFEVRYPPYAFMTGPPHAYDAKAYLECAKSRL
jgi:hypothetical protein